MDPLTTLVRLLLAVFLSGLIGYERERKKKPAGFRTNIMVGLGSCLVMMLSIQSGLLPDADPTRIAAGVITGIGFLGAGLIIQAHRGRVFGITTAATIWLVAAVGLAVGLGAYSAAIMTTVIALVVLRVLGNDKVRKRIRKGR